MKNRHGHSRLRRAHRAHQQGFFARSWYSDEFRNRHVRYKCCGKHSVKDNSFFFRVMLKRLMKRWELSPGICCSKNIKYQSYGKYHTDASLAIATIRPERSAELDVAVGEVQHRLRQASRLHNAPDFDGTLALDQFSDREEESWGELRRSVSTQNDLRVMVRSKVAGKLTSEYHRYCQVINLMTACSTSFTFP